MNKHQVTVNGKVFKRNSKTHFYSHAIVAYRLKENCFKVVSWASTGELARQRAHAERNVVQPHTAVLEVGQVWNDVAFTDEQKAEFWKAYEMYQKQTDLLNRKIDGRRISPRDYMKARNRIFKGEIVFKPEVLTRYEMSFSQIMLETKLPATTILEVMQELGLKGKMINGTRVWSDEEIKQISAHAKTQASV